MKQRLLFSILPFLFFSLNAFSAILPPSQNCQNLNCVRNHIDQIDTKILHLIAERLAYVKRAGELKQHKQAVYDPTREKAILDQVAKQASKEGIPAPLAKAIFQTILEQSRDYESQNKKL